MQRNSIERRISGASDGGSDRGTHIPLGSHVVMPRRGHPHHRIDVADGDVVRCTQLVPALGRRSMEEIPRASFERDPPCDGRCNGTTFTLVARRESMRTLVRIALFLPLSVLAFSLFAIALAIETMRDADTRSQTTVSSGP